MYASGKSNPRGSLYSGLDFDLINRNRYGTLLVKTCNSYKNADQEIRESILIIETRWLKIQRQLELLREIWPSLDEDYQSHQNTVLHVFQGKAQAAITILDGIVGKPSTDELSVKNLMSKKGEARRAKYAVWVKDRLKSVLDDLKEWSEVFDVSWYLIIRLTNKEVDQQLKPVALRESDPLSILKDLRLAINSTLTTSAELEKVTVFLPPTFMTNARYTPLVFGPAASGIWIDTDGHTRYLVDQPSSISTLPDVCKLAKILREVEPFEFGILTCKGVMKAAKDPASTFKDDDSMMNPATAAFSSSFLFNIPPNLNKPQYLRALLLSNTSKAQPYPLDERFSLARQLAKAVMFVHSAGFVHKNIRPETILILEDNHSSDMWAFLTGFESFRFADGNTIYQGDEEWEKNLYRHPSRQGIHPEEVYSMQHDIYSLGVCLLEIGIGSSLVLRDAKGGVPVPSASIVTETNSIVKDRRKKAFGMKRALVNLAKEELPSRMGRKYSETVVTCLICLDKVDNDFGNESEFLDENGILVGVRFIEKVNHRVFGISRDIC